ncbi:MAG: penicillin-binding protein 2 [Gammaproteobacteria bacterium]|nr:MAG: penicillin-binding protein 2 [Gammaproteobacteria bacterium]
MAKTATLKDHFREGRVFNQRALIAFAFVIFLSLILISRMIFLQVVQFETYTAQSDKNRVSVEPVAPTRGLIFDRNGTLLADNQPTYSVSLLKERVPDIDETIAKIGNIIALKESDAERFKKRLDQRRRPFTPIALRYRLNEEEIAKIAVRLHELPGVEIEANLVRNYPHKKVLAHTIGYVGRINQEELKKVDGNNYSATEHIGKTGIDYKTFNQLNTSKARPLFNRAIQGQYPPGSTIKPVVGLAGVDDGITNWDYTIYDPGWYKLDNDERFYRDWKKYGHGMVNMEKAIVRSCDTYFYELAFNMGIDRIHDFMKPFGFGEKTGLDIVSERSGLLPSRFWKRAMKSQPWYPGETLITGIGQGYMLATPLQLAVATAIIANRGKVVEPRMVKTIDNGSTPEATQPAQQEHKQITLNDPANWDKMITAMRKVVHHPRGTATKLALNLQAYDIAGKTGTAQVLGIKQDEEYDEDKISEWHRDHALFIGFAPVQNPKIAVAAIVENGGSGGSTAGPVVRQVMDAYLLPLLQQQNAPQ